MKKVKKAEIKFLQLKVLSWWAPDDRGLTSYISLKTLLIYARILQSNMTSSLYS